MSTQLRELVGRFKLENDSRRSERKPAPVFKARQEVVEEREAELVSR
jgi:hypothetical protein